MTTARKKFDAMRAEKAAAGLNPEQAALVALQQCARDARAGQLDRKEVVELIVSEETRCGATKQAAELCARDLLDGKPCGFAKRNFGGKPRRVRRYVAKPDPYFEAQSEARSAELSAWANGTLPMGGGSR